MERPDGEAPGRYSGTVTEPLIAGARKEVKDMADPKENLALIAENKRLASTTSVLSALRSYGPKLVSNLNGKLRRGREELVAAAAGTPQAMVDWYELLVSQIHSEMIDAGRDLRTAKSVAANARRNLGRTVRKIRTAYAGVRDQFFSVYGEEEALKLGFSRHTPRNAVVLQEHIEYLLLRLDQVTEMPEPRFGRLPVDLPAQRTVLQPAVLELAEAIQAKNHRQRQLQDAVVVKDEAIGKYDKDFLPLAHGTEALFQIAGMDRQAATVRPVQRRGVTVVEGEEPPAVEKLSGSDSSSTVPVLTGHTVSAEAAESE